MICNIRISRTLGTIYKHSIEQRNNCKITTRTLSKKSLSKFFYHGSRIQSIEIPRFYIKIQAWFSKINYLFFYDSKFSVIFCLYSITFSKLFFFGQISNYALNNRYPYKRGNVIAYSFLHTQTNLTLMTSYYIDISLLQVSKKLSDLEGIKCLSCKENCFGFLAHHWR